MEKNILETEERNFTIEDLHRKKAEAEMLEEKDKQVSAELEEIVSKDENEIMKDNIQEKNLIEKNEDNIFGKIKNFFKKIFGKKQENDENKVNEDVLIEAEKSYIFRDYIRKTEDEETELFDLQQRYRRGEIADSELTQEQINSLCMLYDRQIEDLKRTIKAKEQQIVKYKK